MCQCILLITENRKQELNLISLSTIETKHGPSIPSYKKYFHDHNPVGIHTILKFQMQQ